MGRRTPLPNMPTFAPNCLVTNLHFSIAPSGPLPGSHAERIRPAPLRLQEAVGAEVARDFADLLGKDRGVLDPMPVAVDDGVREPLADFFGRMVRAHLAPPPTGEVRFRMSVCSQDNPSQTALRGPRTRASHLTGPAPT